MRNGFQLRRDFDGFSHSRLTPHASPALCFRLNGGSLQDLRDGVREHARPVPGVYGFCDADGRVVYVGKSKYLRTRLLSYFRKIDGKPKRRLDSDAAKTQRILSRTQFVVWEPVPSELTSLLRELELIQRLRPRYNVKGQPGQFRRAFLCLGRDPAPYLYLAPQPAAHARDTFGPLLMLRRVREAIASLNDCFQLRDCAATHPIAFSDQKDLFTLDRAAGCLRYELETCLGPCAGGCTSKQYRRKVDAARAFLSGRDVSLLEKCRQKMFDAAARKKFEQAGVWRDRWRQLSALRRDLDWLQNAQARHAFVYPTSDDPKSSWWHLVHGGRVQATIPAPIDGASARAAGAVLRRVYEKPPPDTDHLHLDSYDELLLLAYWFEKQPEELARTFSPDDAIAFCQTAKRPKRARPSAAAPYLPPAPLADASALPASSAPRS